MRNLLFLLFLAFSLSGVAQFEKFFYDKTLRMDYFHTGNEKEEIYSIDELIAEPVWAGSRTNLVDTFEYGYYLLDFNH